MYKTAKGAWPLTRTRVQAPHDGEEKRAKNRGREKWWGGPEERRLEGEDGEIWWKLRSKRKIGIKEPRRK